MDTNYLDYTLQIKKYLERYFNRPDASEKVELILTKLEKIPMTLHILNETGIGKTVNSFRKHEGNSGLMAKDLVRRWKLLLVDQNAHSNDLKSGDFERKLNHKSVEEDGLKSPVTHAKISKEIIKDNGARSYKSVESKGSDCEDVSNRNHFKESGNCKNKRDNIEEDHEEKHSSYIKHGEKNPNIHDFSSKGKAVRDSEGSRVSEVHTFSSESNSGHGLKRDARKAEIDEDGDSELVDNQGLSFEDFLNYDAAMIQKTAAKKRVKLIAEDGHNDKNRTSISIDKSSSQKHSSSSSKCKSTSSKHISSKHASSSKEGYKHSSSGKEGHKHSSSGKEGHKRSSSSKEGQKHSSSSKEGHKHSSSSKEGHKHSSSSKEGHKHSSSSKVGHKHTSSSKEGHKHSSSSKETHKHSSSSKEGHKHSSSSKEGHKHTSSSKEGHKHMPSSKEGHKHLPSSKEGHSSSSKEGHSSSSKEGHKHTSSIKKDHKPTSSSKERHKQTSSNNKRNKNVSSGKGEHTKASNHGKSKSDPKSDNSKLTLNIPSPPSKQVSISHDEIVDTLPMISPNYRPLPVIPAKPGTDFGIGLEKAKTRTQVYSGRKVHYLTAVPRLYDACIKVLQDNIDALDFVGGVPYDILKPVLERCNPSQLFTLEDSNPQFVVDTDELWEIHCRRDFRKAIKESDENWRELYLRKHDERDQRLRNLTANISASMAKSKPERTTKLAYVDTIAKAPRSALRAQAKYGTGGSTGKLDPLSKLSSHGGRINKRPTPSGLVALGSRNKDSRQRSAPLMQKTLKLMKKVQARR